jgi:hypothetical protein
MKARCGDGISFGCSIGLGLAISTGHPAGLVAALAMPVACLAPESRKAAFRNALGYYSAGLWPMIPGAQRFLGHSSSGSTAMLLWLCSSMLLALPWTLAWTATSRFGYFWRVPLANLACVVPPLALIGFITPINGAGYLFPGAGWLGLAAAASLPGVILSLSHPTSGATRTCLSLAVAAAIALGLATQVSAPARIPSPSGWEAIDTNFGDLSQSAQEFLAMQEIQQRVAASSTRVLIFPESVVPRWSEATAEFWRQVLAGCRARGQVLAMGAGLPLSVSSSTDRKADAEIVKQYNFAAAIEALRGDGRLPPRVIARGSTGGESRGDSYENTLLFLGAHSSAFHQRIPIPVGMWHPLGGGGVPLHLNGPAVIELDRQRLAVLICYEQILAYPVLASMLQQPTVLVGISNMYWFSGTTIPRYQASAIRAWAKLFGVPYLTATNF